MADGKSQVRDNRPNFPPEQYLSSAYSASSGLALNVSASGCRVVRQ